MFVKNTEIIEALKQNKVSLEQFIKENIGIRIKDGIIKIPTEYEQKYSGGLMMEKYPSEIAQVLDFILSKKNEINSFAEIDLNRGGSFYLIDSYLRFITNKNIQSFAVSGSDKIIRKHGFKEYQQKYPNVEFTQSDLISFEPKENIDFCFVKNGSPGEFLLSNFEELSKYKYIAFHKIIFTPWQKNSWNIVKNVFPEHIEIFNKDPQLTTPVGIGIIDCRLKKINFCELFNKLIGGCGGTTTKRLYEKIKKRIESEKYTNTTVKEHLNQHINLIESRTDFTSCQKNARRKKILQYYFVSIGK